MKKPRREKVDNCLDDPLSQEISALQMKIADLRVDYTRAHAALATLIDKRTKATARRAIIDGIVQGVTEAIAETN